MFTLLSFNVISAIHLHLLMPYITARDPGQSFQTLLYQPMQVISVRSDFRASMDHHRDNSCPLSKVDSGLQCINKVGDKTDHLLKKWRLCHSQNEKRLSVQ